MVLCYSSPNGLGQRPVVNISGNDIEHFMKAREWMKLIGKGTHTENLEISLSSTPERLRDVAKLLSDRPDLSNSRDFSGFTVLLETSDRSLRWQSQARTLGQMILTSESGERLRSSTERFQPSPQAWGHITAEGAPLENRSWLMFWKVLASLCASALR